MTFRSALLPVALLMTVPVMAGARAERGEGSFPPTREEALATARARSLAELGDDVVRFSTSPALGGRAMVIELHRQDAEWATGEVVFLSGHPRLRWAETGRLKLALKIADFEELTSEVDAQLARSEPGTGAPEKDELVVCTDGPGYLTERRKAMHMRWMSGFCGDHPNNVIAGVMADVVNRNSGNMRSIGDGRAGERDA